MPATFSIQQIKPIRLFYESGSVPYAVSPSHPLPVNLAVSVTVSSNTEFPPAATSTDSLANPSTTNVKALDYVWDAANALWTRGRQGRDHSTTSMTGTRVMLNNGIYHTAPATRTNGQRSVEEIDKFGNKRIAANVRYTNDFTTGAPEKSSVTFATATQIRKIGGRVDSLMKSGTYYLMILDTGSVPANGFSTKLMSPQKVIHVAGADTQISIDFADGYIDAPNGSVWVLSTDSSSVKIVTTNSVVLNVLHTPV